MPRKIKPMEHYPAQFTRLLETMPDDQTQELTFPTKKAAEYMRFRWYDFQKSVWASGMSLDVPEKRRTELLELHRKSKEYEVIIRVDDPYEVGAESAESPHVLIFRNRDQSNFHKMFEEAWETRTTSGGNKDAFDELVKADRARVKGEALPEDAPRRFTKEEEAVLFKDLEEEGDKTDVPDEDENGKSTHGYY